MLKQPPIKDFFFSPESFAPATKIRVQIPREPFQLKPGCERYAQIFWTGSEWFLVHPDVTPSIPVNGLYRAALYMGVTIDGSLFILPVTYPASGKTSSWLEGWNDIVPQAYDHWLRIYKNDLAQRYEAEPLDIQEAPRWSHWSIEQLIEMAFEDKLIVDLKQLMVLAENQTYGANPRKQPRRAY